MKRRARTADELLDDITYATGFERFLNISITVITVGLVGWIIVGVAVLVNAVISGA